MSPTLALDATGTAVAVPLRYVAGPEAVATKIRLRLDSIRGQWIEDERIGLPWLDWQEAPATPDVVIEGAVRRQIRDVPGVLSVDRVTVDRTGDVLGIAVEVSVSGAESGPVRALVVSGESPTLPGAWYVLLGGLSVAGVVP